MATQSEISWTDSTFNPWIGCTKVGPGCDHCYAERDFDLRKGRAKWGAGQPRSRTSADNWKQPLRWERKRFMECGSCGWRGECAAELIGCGGCGSTNALQDTRRRVFCASLADVFDNEVDPQWRTGLFALIRNTPSLDWMLLTKRIGNVRRMLADIAHSADPDLTLLDVMPLPNVWIGATVVNQAEADRDIPKLLQVPAAVRFLSIEPMLGQIDLRPEWLHRKAGTHRAGLDWVICGGESGPNARPMHPDWARSLRDQCTAAGVPFLFKQWGEWLPLSNRPNADPPFGFLRQGKKAAGRLLDGVVHHRFPGVAPANQARS